MMLPMTLSFLLHYSLAYCVGVRKGSPVAAHVRFERKCLRSNLRKTIKMVVGCYHYSSVDFQVASKAGNNH